MKDINHLLTALLGSEESSTFEGRLVLSCILSASIISFFSIFANMEMGLGSVTVILVIISFFFYGYAYILGRFLKKLPLAKLLFTVYSILFCNVYWWVDYGSRGSAMYIFPVFFSAMIFVWNNISIKLISIIIWANILLLFSIELIWPDIIPHFPSERARIIDSYAGLLIFLAVLSFLVLNAKKNYIKQFIMAQRSDKLKSAFLANMSHEIRTPLNAIMGFTSLFTSRELSREKKELYSQLIIDNSKYLMQLLSDILDISLIESGQLKIKKSNVVLPELLGRLHQNYLCTIKETGKPNIQLLLNHPPESVSLETDELRFEQIMNNLVNNALKFTSEGYVKIGYYLQDHEYIFFVEDTGSGIKEEFQPEIFNRFVKNDDNLNESFVRGAGIGLSLTKELVLLLGGKIWFTSIYTEGSTFYFSLPFNSTQ